MSVFEISESTCTADDLADELERIAALVREGFTFGVASFGSKWRATITDDATPNA